MIKQFLSFLLVLLSLPVFSAVTVTGRVLDSISQRPIEFVTVTVQNLTTDKTSGGALTNQDGVFNIASVASGEYELRISFVGYHPYSMQFTVEGSDVRLGDILVLENTTILQEVQVVGQGSQMRFDIDKRVFSVDQNIASSGGSATDVLENIPSVDVDGDGNISLRNNSSVEVWINGKPSGLTADNRAQILQQMPAENIEAIEIMTNPSAKYNPEGTAGIINLVMKKNRKSGYYGSVSAGLTMDKGKLGYNSGASINYNVGKFDMYANVGYRKINSSGGGFTERTNFNNGDTTVLTQVRSNSFDMSGLFFRSGIDYYIDAKNTVGIGWMGHFGTPRSISNTDYILKDKAANSILRDYSRKNNGSDSHRGFNINLYHKIDFDKNGSNLLTNIIYSKHGNSGEQTFTQEDKTILSNRQDITQNSDANSDGIEAKSDFTWKFNENNRLELGWSSRWNNRLGESKGFNNLENLPIDHYFNIFDYKEQIHALYATYGMRINNFSVQAGLRGEYFDYTSVSTPIEEEKKVEHRHYAIEPFPSVYLSYSLPRNSEIQLNYTRRINRPRGRSINPFKDYSDSTNISYGNPFLRPEISSAFELNYIKNWDNHTISSTLYYRFDNDEIERVSFMNNGIMESTFMNLTREHDYGLELISKNRLFKMLNLTSTLNLYYNRLDASVYQNELNPGITVNLPGIESFAWDARVIANLMFSPTFSGQITSRYRSAELTAQGERFARHSTDIGLRKTFFNRKLSAAFNVRDLFNTRGYKGTTWGEGFTQYSESRWRGRQFGLTLTYEFGNMKPKPSTRPRPEEMENGGEMDEMQ
ncbi:MAG: TonB-dependent receptor [Porphyromonadaceae bacterium]|nr:TonB-dependent receptor [Porphyromonadaceae bacterium]